MNYKISICMVLCMAIHVSGMAAAQEGLPASAPAIDQGASVVSSQAATLAAYQQCGQAAATSGTYGTKVKAVDEDVGLPLSGFTWAPPQTSGWVFYWDIGTTPGIYDDKDVAYLRFGPVAPPVQVQANNIRLTGWGVYPAGSYVKPGDLDIGQALIMPPPALPSVLQANLYYMNVAGGPGYDLGDPVYLKLQSPFTPPPPAETDSNDIRITPNAGFQSGSRVSLNDPDAGKRLTALTFPAIPGIGGPIPTVAAFGDIVQFAFFNVNGNSLPFGATPSPIYDEGDVVYLDAAPFNSVSPNDVRLY